MSSSPEQFELTFHGTRGTRTTTGAQNQEFGGHTTCIGLTINGRRLVFDSGSGIVQFGQRILGEHFATGAPGPVVSYLFHTHCHYDHICGFPYYGPLYFADSTTYVFGPRSPGLSFEQALRLYVHPPFHPVPIYEMEGTIVWGEVCEPEAILFVKGQEAPLSVNVKHSTLRKSAPPPEDVELVVRTLRGYNHPKSGVMMYRIEHAGRAVVIATDTEGYVFGDRRLIQFSRGADVLIHDAMYTRETYAETGLPTQGWGHATIDCAANVARAAGVERLYLIHHNPSHNDEELRQIEVRTQALFPGTIAARDGHTLDLLKTFDRPRPRRDP